MADTGTPTVRPTRRTAVLGALAVVGGVAIHLGAQAGMMLSWAGWSPSTFRNYFYSDQLAYLSIAANAAHGDLGSVEPLTQTGSIYYPRGYYLLLGLAARLTSTSVSTMWTMVGLLAQVLLVAVVGVTCVLLTRRWWTGILGFLPFLLGTFGWFLSDGWMTLLGSHAVLWGPAAVMYTLNGESVALCLSGAALLSLVLVGAGRVPQRAVWPVAVVACLVVGLLANIQTYSFLVSVYVLGGCAAAVGLVRSRDVRATAATGGLIVLLAVVGRPVAAHVGPLATLAMGLVPALPGLVSLGRATGRKILWCVGAVALGAAPQILATVVGVLADDPFLAYRDSSSKDLGVPWPTGFLAAAGVVPLLILVLVVGMRRRRVLWVALPAGLSVVWVLLATNDLWGANQEPYRFWLDTYVLVAILLIPLTAWVAVETLAREPAHPSVADRADRPPRHLSTRGRVVVAVSLVVAIGFAGLSSLDFRLWRRDVSALGYVRLLSPRYVAAADLLARADDGIVVPDQCLDPLFLKVAWGGPVAYYNMGLAWPDHREAIDLVLSARDQSVVDSVAADEAGIRWLVTSTACSPGITPPDGSVLVGSVSYPSDGGDPAGTLRLWQLAP